MSDTGEVRESYCVRLFINFIFIISYISYIRSVQNALALGPKECKLNNIYVTGKCIFVLNWGFSGHAISSNYSVNSFTKSL